MPTSGRGSNRSKGANAAVVLLGGSGAERTIATAPTVTATARAATPLTAPITGQSIVLTN
jgi:hypothetical protein